MIVNMNGIHNSLIFDPTLGGRIMSDFHATTIFAIQHRGQCAMAGDGQVTMGNAVVMKHTAKKVRRLFNGKVLAGFAGSVADAFTLYLNCLKVNLKSITEICHVQQLSSRNFGEVIRFYVD